MSRSKPLFTLALSLLASLATASATFAKGSEPLDSSSQEALRQTQQMMTDQTARAKMLQSDSKAAATDATVRQSLGNNTDGAYQISSEVLETLVNKTGGDPAKMQELANQLMANPNAIEQYLTPAQREKIRSMASEMEAKSGNTSVPAAK